VAAAAQPVKCKVCNPLPSPSLSLLSHLLDIGPGLPVAADAVPLLRGADDEVGGEEGTQVGGVVT
jgi:hypothetical protein